MKPERQIVELAKLDNITGIRPSRMVGGRQLYAGRKNDIPIIVADYLRSHDALQPIINGMDDDQRTAYSIELCKLMTTDEEQDYIPSANYMAEAVELLIRAIVATPEQTAEAILKALGKWEQD